MSALNPFPEDPGANFKSMATFNSGATLGEKEVRAMLTRDQWDPDRMMDGWNDGDMMDGSGVWVMVLVTVLLVALLATVLVLVVRASSASPPPTAHTTPAVPPTGPSPPMAPLTAREVLDLRLARGEITRAEYAEMRHDLSV